MDRSCDYSTKIKVPGFVPILNRDRNISTRRCACMHGTSLGVFSTGRISLMLSGCFAFGGGSVDCSDWPRVYCAECAVDFSPGEVWIGYISAAGFTSCWTFCSTDCVLLAGFGLSLRRVSECWTNGAALVENRAGITFGVELYVPWDAPEAVVDISSEGVVSLTHSRCDWTGRSSGRCCRKPCAPG